MAEAHRDEIAKLEALYASNPEGRVFTHLAEAYRKNGDLDRARQTLTEGIRRHPDSASAYVVLGRVLTDGGDVPGGYDAFRRALELDSHNLVALRWCGDLAMRSGRIDDALGYYHELMARDPSDAALRERVAGIEADRAVRPDAARIEEIAPAAPELVPPPLEPAASFDIEESSLLDIGHEQDFDLSDLPGDLGVFAGRQMEDRAGRAAPERTVPAGEPFESAPPEPSIPITDHAADADALAAMSEAFDAAPDPTFEAEPEPADEAEPAALDGLMAWETEADESPDDTADELPLLDLSDFGGEDTDATAAPEEPLMEASFEPGIATFDVGAFDLEDTESASTYEDLVAPAMPPAAEAYAEVPLAPADAPGSDAPFDRAEAEATDAADPFDAGSAPAEARDAEGERPMAAFDDASAAFEPEAVTPPAVFEPEPVTPSAAFEPEVVRPPAAFEPESVTPPITPSTASPLVTETMAELYRNQGFLDRAADVYRQLLSDRPGDARLQERLAEIESAMRGARADAGAAIPGGEPAISAATADTGASAEPSAAAPAEELVLEEDASGELWLKDTPSPWTTDQAGSGATDTPYWSGEPDDGAVTGEPIAAYFRSLLEWRPGRGSAVAYTEIAEPAAVPEATPGASPEDAFGSEPESLPELELSAESVVAEAPAAESSSGDAPPPYLPIETAPGAQDEVAPADDVLLLEDEHMPGTTGHIPEATDDNATNGAAVPDALTTPAAAQSQAPAWEPMPWEAEPEPSVTEAAGAQTSDEVPASNREAASGAELMPWELPDTATAAAPVEPSIADAEASPPPVAPAAPPRPSFSAADLMPWETAPAAEMAPAESGAAAQATQSSASEEQGDDEDLEMFRSWLQSLKK